MSHRQREIIKVDLRILKVLVEAHGSDGAVLRHPIGNPKRKV
jgi:hypothetical protein